MSHSYPFGVDMYRARCVKVWDADTIHIVVDLGFGRREKLRVRLARIDAAERNDKDPEERNRAWRAKEALEALIPWGRYQSKSWPLRVKPSYHPGKYHRYMVEVWCVHHGVEVNVNDWLIHHGYAVLYA